MKVFSVMLDGRNFPMLVEGRLQLMGFIVTRFLKANDSVEAGLEALLALEKEEKFKRITELGRGTLEVVRVQELLSPNFAELRQTGFVFYPEESQDGVQH